MGIIVQKTADFLDANAPAVYSWFTGKEQGTGLVSDTIVDYTLERDFVAGGNIDKALANAIRAPGAAGAGLDFANADGLGIEFGPNDHFIGIVTAINLGIADSYLYYGSSAGNKGIRFAEAGVPSMAIKPGSGPANIYSDPDGAAAGGTVAYYVGLRRDTDEAEFGHITTLGAVAAKRIVAAAETRGQSFNFGGTLGGISLYNGAAAATPLGLYNMVVCRFSGDFPEFDGADGFSQELVEWRADSAAGVKEIPPFTRTLVV